MPKLINAISVFFPAYNEEANIQGTVEKARDHLMEIAEIWEILVVNDGSKDKTKEIVESLHKKDPRIKLIDHKDNQGYGASLKSGLYNAQYPFIVFTDSDGQFDFSEVDNFIAKQKETGADMVIGYYLDRKVSKMTILSSKVWELCVYVLFRLKVQDIDCGFKLISKKVVDGILKLESQRGAFISSELLIKAKKKGFKMVEIGVHHYPRKAGQGTGRKLSVIIQSFIDLFKLWLKLH
jgi:glycosyltransferase involved in cell wall biosynthesis